MVKHGRADLVSQAGLDGYLDEPDPEVVADAAELADDLEAMGPTFIKLGQLLSTRSDLISPVYAEALTRLQDHVEPFGFDEVEHIVETELGARLSNAFGSFDSTPLASASLSQVHRATMRDGRPVVVKVQRPGIRKQIAEDMDALADLAALADRHSEAGRRYGFAELFDQFRRSLENELDFRREASNLVRLGRILEPYDRLVVPQPIEDYTTSTVLTMTYIPGTKVTAMGPLRRLDLDGAALADQLFQGYLNQILVEGFFHADPHPGNVLLTDDDKLALVDVGMVARVPKAMRETLVRLLLALSDGNGVGVAEGAMTLGEARPGFDQAAFCRAVTDLVEREESLNVTQLDAGTTIAALLRISGETGLRLPAELSMLGKALLNLDMVARSLDPGFEPTAAIKAHSHEIMQSQVRASTGSIFSAMLDARDFVEQFPGRLNKVMDALADGNFHLDVKAFDENELLKGLHKVANRLTMGLVLAALIVGAAMLMRVPTSSKLLGYPSVAIVCFFVAGGAGVALLASIVHSDRLISKRTKGRKP